MFVQEDWHRFWNGTGTSFHACIMDCNLTISPCIHNPQLCEWYAAMDQIPVYACRVKGDAGSWREVLRMTGFGSSGLPPAIQENIESRVHTAEVAATEEAIDWKIWGDYSSSRPFVADTPHGEAASVIVCNRFAVVKDTLKQISTPFSSYFNPGHWMSLLPSTEAEIELMLSSLAQLLLVTGSSGSIFPEDS
jgi:hypothetical protein